jgi:rsbT antagonist protein RsbS
MSAEKISVIRLHNRLLVTIPADPDDATISILQDNTLEAMEQHDVKALVLDLSKVESFDSYFARVVAETAGMVILMGGETIIAGMRPAVAITATQLGLTLSTTRTALSVERAFQMLEQPAKVRRRA